MLFSAFALSSLEGSGVPPNSLHPLLERSSNSSMAQGSEGDSASL